MEYHFGNKRFTCIKCNKNKIIPFNTVGGLWHLSGWEDATGKKWYGMMCSSCFHKLSQEKRKS